MTVLETERLSMRRLTTVDAPYILELVNEPAFLRYIGDKGVRNLDDARRYILDGPVDCYETHGFGMYLALLKSSDTPIGICGLLHRDGLDDPDIGFAFSSEYWSRGYAGEATVAVLGFEREQHELQKILAITAPDNKSSIRLLEKVGFALEGKIRLPGEDSDVNLFVS